MSLHRVCCCSPSPCVCTGCGYASSYLASCAAFTGQWSHQAKFAPCGNIQCSSFEEANETSVTVNLSGTFPSGPITRIGTSPSCCYSRTGYIDITYNINIADRAACCYNPAVCTNSVVVSGVAAVPFCHTVTPICLYGTTCSWLHTLSVCSFDIGQHELIADLGFLDCQDFNAPLDCNALPLERYRLMVSSASWQWVTPIGALSALAPADFKPNGFCVSPPTCGCTHDYGLPPGPFSILLAPDRATAYPNCARPDGYQYRNWSGSWTDCRGDTGSKATEFCDGDGSYSSVCCNREFEFLLTRPCYT